MHFKVDLIPPHCGVEVDRGMVRAFTDAGHPIGQPRLYSKWRNFPTDTNVVKWADFEWAND